MVAKHNNDECEFHPELTERLGRIDTHLIWIKAAIWSIPSVCVITLLAFAGYITGIDNRVTACETKLNMIKVTNGNSEIPRHVPRTDRSY